MRAGYASVGEHEAALLQRLNALDPAEYVLSPHRYINPPKFPFFQNASSSLHQIFFSPF